VLRTTVAISTFTVARSALVRKSVESVLAQEPKPDELLLVLDPDETLVAHYRGLLADLPQVQVLAAPRKGLSAARNHALEVGTGDVVLFLDDDARAEPGWLNGLTQPFQDKDVGVTGGAIVADWDGHRPSWFPEELDWVVGCTFRGFATKAGPVRNVIGASMATRRIAALAAAGFEEGIGREGKTLTGSEEMEFCLRMGSVWKILFVPDAVVLHHVPKSRQTIRYLLKRSAGEGISKRRVRKMSQGKPALANEGAFLRSLPGAIGRRLLVPKPSNLAQAAVLPMATATVIGSFLLRRA